MTSSSFATSSLGAPLTGKPFRVLIVDDERDTVVSLAAILRHEGYDVRGVYDAASALSELRDFDADAIVVDIAMRGMSGWDLAREIRRQCGSKPTLIAISGTYVTAPDQVMSEVAGFNYFLQKPCNPLFLLSILAANIPGK